MDGTEYGGRLTSELVDETTLPVFVGPDEIVELPYTGYGALVEGTTEALE